MADRSMKAVIRAEVDPSGVVRGVQTATRELEKLNRTAARTALASGVTAAMQVGRGVVDVTQRAASLANERVNELVAMTTANDVAAANAATIAFGERVLAERAAAQRLAPGVIQGIQARSVAEQAGLARLTPEMGTQLGNIMQAQALGAEARNVAGEVAATAFGEVIGYLREISEKLGRPF